MTDVGNMGVYDLEMDLAEVQRVAKLGSWRFTQAGEAVSWSKELFRIFDLEESEFDGCYDSFLSRVHPDDKPLVLATNRKARNSGEPFDIVYRILTRDGSIRHIREVGYAVKDTAGRVNGLFGTAQDITRFKHIEAKLSQNERYLRTILQTTADGFWVIDCPQQRVVEVNEAYCRMSGYSREEILKLRINDLEALESPADTAARIGRIISQGFDIFETRHRRKDGSILDVEVSVTYLPVDGGQFICFCRDIGVRKQYEAALRQSQCDLDEATEIAQLGRWELDLASGRLAWSDVIYSLFEVDREHFGASYNAFLGFIHPDDRNLVNEAYWKSVEQKKGYAIEHRLLMRDGRVKWVSEIGRTEYNDIGEPIRSVGTVQDITDRKEIESERVIVLELLRQINFANGLHALMANVTRLMREWSGCEAVGIRLRDGEDFPYFETLGFPARFVELENRLCARDVRGELLRDSHGNPILECMCGNVICGRFDPAKPFFTANGTFWTNSTTDLLSSTSEADRQSRTRNRCHGEGYESVALIPLRHGGQSFGLLQFNDARRNRFTPAKISLLERLASNLAVGIAQRRTAEALAKNEAKYRALVDQSVAMIYLHDLQGRIIEVNAAALTGTGYSKSEITGMVVFDLHPDHSRKNDIIADWERWPAGYSTTLEARHRRKDGTVFPVEVRTGKISLSDGHFILALVYDISARKKTDQEREKLHERLLQAQKMESVGRLAGGVAHDYNNMLSVIMGYTEMALAQVGEQDPLHADLTEIMNAATRSKEITRQLLAFARKQTIDPRVLDLNETVEGMLKMLRRLIGEDIDLAWLPGSRLWPIRFDPAQIDQLMVNLCLNARDAITGVGKVTIETGNFTFDDGYCELHAGFTPGTFVMLAVSDDGCGMDKQTLDHIFEPFFTTKAVNEGTGLGLATVYGIVNQNNGFINVYSEPGKGTTFKIYLPRHASAPDRPKPESAAETPTARGETVLLVEDETAILNMERLMLTRLGYQVITADSPRQALRLFSEHAGMIHLLITDVVMPEMNGRELSEELRALRPDLKTLFMSGYTANVIAHRGVLEEGMHFIQKPFSKHDLGCKIRQVLDAS